MSEPRGFGIEVYKLTKPQEQVGMPNTHKWAVKSDKDGFIDSFKTKAEANHYADALDTEMRERLATKLIAEVVEEEKIRDYTKQLLKEHAIRCEGCAMCTHLKELMEKR